MLRLRMVGDCLRHDWLLNGKHGWSWCFRGRRILLIGPGLRPRQVHDQVLRSELPRKLGGGSCSQITVDLPQYVNLRVLQGLKSEHTRHMEYH